MRHMPFSLRRPMQRLVMAYAFSLPMLYTSHANAKDEYPNHLIRLIIGFSAGGTTDIMGRAAATEMSKELGQPVVVENRTGAAGSVMAAATIAAPPDGYTVCVCGSGPQVLLPLIDKAAENYPRDLAPVGMLYKTGYILIGRSTIKADTAQELIANIKAHPGKFTYGSSGVGGIQHLGMEMLADELKSPMVHVPYKGEQPAAVDIAAGQVDLMMATPTTAQSMIKLGKVKAYASTGDKPNALFPNLPTLQSLGYPDLLVHTFAGLNVTKDTPPEVITKLSAAAAVAVKSDDFKQRAEEAGMTIPPSGPQAYAEFVSDEIKRWTPVTKKLNFQRQ